MITANFTAYSKYETDTLYQWDQNRTLRVAGLSLSGSPEVHFSNATMNGAIPVEPYYVGDVNGYGIIDVKIPNSLLQEPLRISAHIGTYEGNEFKVLEVVEIPVKPRKRPYDYQLAEDDFELYSFNRLEAKISVLENKTESFGTETAAGYPTDGTHERGSIIFNSSPNPGGYVGWICTTAGTPGVWKGFGLIEE